jgi:glycosyltransferase involved in cell wall biosynthesis
MDNMSTARATGKTMDMMGDFPLVTIVTPTKNAGRYLAETIESVLSQDYPHIEYIAVDGGSTDDTSQILARYEPRVRVFRETDAGAAQAINRGFRRGTGDICAWLSADDTLLPGSVAAAVRRFQFSRSLGVVYGEGNWTASDSQVLARYPTSPDAIRHLWRECLICQPSAFVRRSALEEVGYLDENLKTAFDYDLWIRLSKLVEFGYLDRYLATSRMHRANLTLAQRGTALREAMNVQLRHFGYTPFQAVYGYCAYRVDTRDQFFEPIRLSIRAYFLSLGYGMLLNRRSRGRFFREWVSKLNPAQFLGYCNGVWSLLRNSPRG